MAPRGVLVHFNKITPFGARCKPCAGVMMLRFRVLVAWGVFSMVMMQMVHGKPLKYPEGVKPGDSISGQEGEFFRYTSVVVKPPDDEDREISIAMGADIKCDACQVLVKSLVTKAESSSEDHIMDQFDGELKEMPQLTDDQQVNRVNLNRKGCNKHFKDELILRGWGLKKCKELQAFVALPGPSGDLSGQSTREREWCLEKRKEPKESAADTYNTHNEAVFYACENTISKYGQEMALFLEETLEDGVKLDDAARDACHQVADCDGAIFRKRRQKAREMQKRNDAKPKKLEKRMTHEEYEDEDEDDEEL